MSNALGIAAVSAVMRDLLNNGLVDASVGDVTVTAQSPDKVKLDGDEQSQLNRSLEIELTRTRTDLEERVRLAATLAAAADAAKDD